MRYAVDIDGTICTQTKSDYTKAEPIPDNIKKINDLYDQGHYIIYWTVRGRSSGINWFPFTFKQLRSWGCKFHELNTRDKADVDVYIDDSAKRIEEI